VKSPARDKQPGFDNKIGLDDPRFDPAIQPGLVTARPFILATPHHFSAWAGEAQTGTPLGQIEQAMAAGEAELQQLDADDRQLLAEYEAAGGKTGLA
jgi:hypothetical protein